MSKEKTYSPDLLDIVFEHRNKEYGAYPIRRSYNENVRKSVTIVLSITALLIVFTFWKFGKEAVQGIRQIVTIQTLSEPITIETPKPEIPEKLETPSVPEKVKTVQNLPPQVVEDQKAATDTKPIASENDLKNAASGAASQNGTPDTGSKPATPPNTNTGGTGAAAQPKAPEDDNQVFDGWTEQMPEFQGGQEALLKWLSKNIEYPSLARETGIEGTVLVEFIVNKDGSIVDSKIIKDIGAGCGKEVLRAASKMPKWKAGKQNGKEVRVKYKLPVRFRLPSN